MVVAKDGLLSPMFSRQGSVLYFFTLNLQSNQHHQDDYHNNH